MQPSDLYRPSSLGADYLTNPGAHELASRIVGYWKQHGHLVEVSVEYQTGSREGYHVVRSNLFNGLPR